MRYARVVQFGLLSLSFCAGSVFAETVFYNNDIPDGKIGTVSGQIGSTEFESADDFFLSANNSKITGGSFTGLLPAGATISNVSVEIYTVQTTEINSRNVPTRVNSPSNAAIFDESASFQTHTLNNGVGIVNSVDSTIKPAPGHTSAESVTGGNGPRVGEEVRFDFTVDGPTLAKGQYFFVPKVTLDNGQHFLWLSAGRPVSGFGTTPFPSGLTDLQSWIRNDPGINPDWERVGRDVIGPDSPFAATYNASFRLVGTVVPEPTGIVMMIAGLIAVGAWSQRKRT